MGGGENSLFPFLKIEKSDLILEKNDLIVFIYGLNFSFKTLLRVSKKKKMVKFFLRGLSSSVVDEIYIEVLLFQETSPALKNFLVAPLGIYLSCSGR